MEVIIFCLLLLVLCMGAPLRSAPQERCAEMPELRRLQAAISTGSLGCSGVRVSRDGTRSSERSAGAERVDTRNTAPSRRLCAGYINSRARPLRSCTQERTAEIPALRRFQCAISKGMSIFCSMIRIDRVFAFLAQFFCRRSPATCALLPRFVRLHSLQVDALHPAASHGGSLSSAAGVSALRSTPFFSTHKGCTGSPKSRAFTACFSLRVPAKSAETLRSKPQGKSGRNPLMPCSAVIALARSLALPLAFCLGYFGMDINPPDQKFCNNVYYRNHLTGVKLPMVFDNKTLWQTCSFLRAARRRWLRSCMQGHAAEMPKLKWHPATFSLDAASRMLLSQNAERSDALARPARCAGTPRRARLYSMIRKVKK